MERSHVVCQLVDEYDDDYHRWWGCVLLNFCEEKVYKGHYFLRPCMIGFLLHTVQYLLAGTREVESIAAASLEVDNACFRLAFTHCELGIHVFVGLVTNVYCEQSDNDHNGIVWKSCLAFGLLFLILFLGVAYRSFIWHFEINIKRWRAIVKMKHKLMSKIPTPPVL